MTSKQADFFVQGLIGCGLDLWLAVERARERDANWRLTFTPYEVRMAEDMGGEP